MLSYGVRICFQQMAVRFFLMEGGTFPAGVAEFAFGSVIPALHSASLNDGPVYEQLRL